MSQASTTILLSQRVGKITEPTIVSEPIKAAGYYSGNADLQTFSWNIKNFKGSITFQATLVNDPVETDWFNLQRQSYNVETENKFLNVQGKFVYIRAKITGFTEGTINNIKVSF
jgi:hypothetical protein